MFQPHPSEMYRVTADDNEGKEDQQRQTYQCDNQSKQQSVMNNDNGLDLSSIVMGDRALQRELRGIGNIRDLKSTNLHNVILFLPLL